MLKTLKTTFLAAALAFAVPAFATETKASDASYITAELNLPADDVVAIQQLMYQLNHAVDVGDYVVYASFFTDDSVFATPFGQAIGPTEITAALEQSRPFISGKRHVATNILVTGEGDKAVATSYLIVYEATTALELVGTAVNVDTLEKRDGEWIVVRHETSLDPATIASMQAAKDNATD